MAYAYGLLIALGVFGLAGASGLDRSRAFFPTVLIVVAAYYLLFAAMAGGSAMGEELAGFALFTAAAVIGFRTSLWIAAAGLLGHGLFDLIHHRIITNPGVPGWWPGFCTAADVGLAAYLALRLWRGAAETAPSSSGAALTG